MSSSWFCRFFSFRSLAEERKTSFSKRILYYNGIMILNKIRMFIKSFGFVVFIGLLTVLFADPAGNSLHITVSCFFYQDICKPELYTSEMRFFYITAFTFLFVFSFYLGHGLFRPRTRELHTAHIKPVSHLILFLSTFSNFSKDSVKYYAENNQRHDFLKDLRQAFNAGFDPEKSPRLKKYNWEMPLRAIHHHKERLKHLYLICSNESLPQAYRFLKQCIPEKASADFQTHILAADQEMLQIKNVKDIFSFSKVPGNEEKRKDSSIESLQDGIKGIEFGDFDRLSEALIYLVEKIQSEGVSEDEIVIDVTGGQKTASIAGAIITINRNVKFQYMETVRYSDHEKIEIKGYDIIMGQTAKDIVS